MHTLKPNAELEHLLLCVCKFKNLKGSVCKEAARVKLIKIGEIDWIQIVLSLLSECTKDSSRERLHKLQIQYSADPTDSGKARPHFPLT